MIQGAKVIHFGVPTIGMLDRLLRPMLVGKDTRRADYVVLIPTLGGVAVCSVLRRRALIHLRERQRTHGEL